MTQIMKPMLACEYDEDKLKFPVYASPKLDGYRAFVHNGILTTRSGKPVANLHVQKLFGRPEFEGLDGELIVGDWSDPDVFNKTSGPLRRVDGEPDAAWYVFDDRSAPSDPYAVRLERIRSRVFNLIRNTEFSWPKIEVLSQLRIESLHELDMFESETVERGFEGVMIRDPNGPYKAGRSTVKEGYLLKVKRFAHDEGTIIGFDELMHNGNEAFKDELGRTKRSEVADGLVPSGMLGSFIVTSPKWTKEFKVSAGSMSNAERAQAMAQFDEMYKGQLVRFKHFPHGAKDRPRHGLFAGLRDPNDMG